MYNLIRDKLKIGVCQTKYILTKHEIQHKLTQQCDHTDRCLNVHNGA